MSSSMTSEALISDCGLYRYTLSRVWAPKLPQVLFIGLNPSTADAMIDDPTVRRFIGFSRAWHCGGFTLGNLFAFRATRPRDIMAAPDPVGPSNDDYLVRLHRAAALTVACWGVNGAFQDRDRAVVELLQFHETRRLHCIATTKDGHPAHPLYLPGHLKPTVFTLRRSS